MPYIQQDARYFIINGGEPGTAGELNYAITMLLRRYYDAGPSYSRANDVLGALEGAKLEFYRRVVAPYEDKKIAANGDVY